MGIDAPMAQKRAISEDGTSIAYYVIGSGPEVWMMPPAMGAPILSMKFLFERFARRFTIVTWDQRGFYGSAPPKDPDRMKVSDHMDDMHAVVAAEKLDRRPFVLGGWSMAVQLSLEYYHRRPDDVRALVLINGPYERALRNLTPIPGAESVAMAALRIGVAARRVLNPLSLRILGARGMGSLLHRAGVVAENPAFFEEILAEFCTVDWGRYFTMTRYLHEHSAAAYLGEVRVPTLITTGTHDLLTPRDVAERMHRAIPRSELVVIPRATHYIVAEFPDVLGDHIARFLDRALGDADVASRAALK
jgi:pimeloyl-ACP methyl ester carboxylesterase